MYRLIVSAVLACLLHPGLSRAQEVTLQPVRRVVDLKTGETKTIELSDGRKTTVKLVSLHEMRDEFRDAVREARVTAEVDGTPVTLLSANYNLPVTVGGVQIDCPITRGYYTNMRRDSWGLTEGADARFRLWPAGSPWLTPGTFVYPARQRWFASDTQMSNEPVFVDAGEDPANKSIYYHNGLDIGGAEGMVDIVAATDGLVVSKAGEVLPGYEEDTPVRARYDVIYILDDRGWYYRYSHLKSHETAVRLGERVKMGRKLGELGKEGASGGWSHFHFDITCRQPSGKWGTEEGYAYYWEAYVNRYKPPLIAVARPHRVAAVGEPVRLDGGLSRSLAGRIVFYDWLIPADGNTRRPGAGRAAADRTFRWFIELSERSDAVAVRTYDRPGVYSEVLRVTDDRGNVDYDFTVVNVIDKDRPENLPPTIHAAYSPTFGIRPGDPVTFKVRVFRSARGGETWDFGDGTPPVRTESRPGDAHLPDGYAGTVHRFAAPGYYIVRVEHTAENGYTAVAHLDVRVEEER